MNIVYSFLGSGISTAISIWLFKIWISERLKQSVKFEYSEKLLAFKTEMNLIVNSIKHENQIMQLRTSLFFDHQRNAFASIITMISNLNDEWKKKYDPIMEGLYEPVPKNGFIKLKCLINEHQLFLDDECLMALSLILDTYSNSFPLYDSQKVNLNQHNCSFDLDCIEYIQPRLASIFKNKIGVNSNKNHLLEITVLTAVKLLNNYNFPEVGVPPTGTLKIKPNLNASEIEGLGEKHFNELIKLLIEFDKYLNRDGGWIHEAQFKVKRCLNIILNLQVNDMNNCKREII